MNKKDIESSFNTRFYVDWHKKCRDFMLWYDGYVKGSGVAVRKLITLFGDLEELVFSRRMTESWI